MIVADASFVVEALDGVPEAIRIVTSEAVEAPHLIDAEVAQALRMLVIRGVVTADTAEDRLRRWVHLPVRRHDAAALMSRVWALRDVLRAYDALHVALAERLGCPLVTADRRLAGAPGVACEVLVVRGD
ncbi:MAG: type II toxin-antitoxin system VapC family toxin [Thermoleophilia bacterium]